MIAVIQTILLVLAGFFLVYLAMLSALALVAPKHRDLKTLKVRKFAVVVPAHDEESTIAKTLGSLNSLDYPRGLFDLIVIADNCEDRTAEIARSVGAQVFERRNLRERGKGYALRWCFDLLLSRRAAYDAVVVIDADTVASDNLLCVFNAYLERGAQAIQCSDLVEPGLESWSTEVTRIGFTLYNYVRPLGRRVLGCSAGLRGNGMCFTSEILQKIPWQSYSLTEDLEYGLELLLNDVQVVFAPEARVFATMPQYSSNAETQRTRWETGRFPLLRKYAGRFLWIAVKRMSLKAFDAFVDLVTQAFVNLIAFVLLMLCLNLFLWVLGVEQALWFVWWWSCLMGAGLFHVLVGLYAARADRSMYLALLQVPRFAVWKLMLYSKLIKRSRTEQWIRTAREDTVGSPVPDETIHQ